MLESLIRRPDLTVHHRVANHVHGIALRAAVRRKQIAVEAEFNTIHAKIVATAQQGIMHVMIDATSLTKLSLGATYFTRGSNDQVHITSTIEDGDAGYSQGYRFVGTSVGDGYRKQGYMTNYMPDGRFNSSQTLVGSLDLVSSYKLLDEVRDNLVMMGYSVIYDEVAKETTISW